MIGALEPVQWDAFCEALNKLENRHALTIFTNIRRALFIARSYPIQDKKI